MSKNLINLLEEEQALKAQIAEAYEMLRAIELLKRRYSNQTPSMSISNGHTDLKGLSVRKATVAIIENWKARTFTSDEVVQAILSARLDAKEKSVKNIVGGVLREYSIERHKLERVRVSESNVVKYTYSWNGSSS